MDDEAMKTATAEISRALSEYIDAEKNRVEAFIESAMRDAIRRIILEPLAEKILSGESSGGLMPSGLMPSFKRGGHQSVTGDGPRGEPPNQGSGGSKPCTNPGCTLNFEHTCLGHATALRGVYLR